jgi:hypothetical protein
MQQLHTWSVAMMHTIMSSVCMAGTGDLDVTLWVTAA